MHRCREEVCGCRGLAGLVQALQAQGRAWAEGRAAQDGGWDGWMVVAEVEWGWGGRYRMVPATGSALMAAGVPSAVQVRAVLAPEMARAQWRSRRAHPRAVSSDLSAGNVGRQSDGSLE